MTETNIAGDAAQTSETTTNATSEKTIKKPSPKVLGAILILIILAALAYNYKSLYLAASVDGSLISRYSVIKKLEQQNGKTALDAIIDDRLVNNAADKQNITANDEEIGTKLNTIKTQIESQGGSLDAALNDANLTMDDLKKQIILQVKLEKLLADRVSVSEDEVNKFITDNQVPIEAGKEEETKNKVREELKNQKLSGEYNKYLTELRAAAKINTYVQY